MNWKTKVVVVLAVVAVAAFFGMRELRSSCARMPAADAHGHGHGKPGSHADEGFRARVCEVGVFGIIEDALGFTNTSDRSVTPHAHGHGDEGDHEESAGHAHGEEESEGLIKLTPSQIRSADIEIAPVTSGKLVKEIAVPGRIAINANAEARIVPRLSGTAARIEKQLGEQVRQGDLLALIESREMADAKAEYLASWRAKELARSVYEREERLWKQRVTAEQDYLAARNGYESARIKLDLAHQRLHTIGLSDDEIESLAKVSDEAQSRFYEIRSPIAGRVTARNIVLGQMVSTDREIFTIADTSRVWIEMAVAPGDLGFARKGQSVRVEAGEQKGIGTIIALSPLIDSETRSAKAIAELDNTGSAWRLGDYVSARLLSGEQDVGLVVPNAAIQSIKGEKVVFASADQGFRVRPIVTGRADSVNVEVLSGLKPGEKIAISNTFMLKAEFGKSEAEHEHE